MWLARFYGVCILLSILLTACAKMPPPRTVDQVDLDRYMGAWYEIASFPNFFQRRCQCTKVFYTLKQEKVTIRNQCYRGVDGPLVTATASAWPVLGANNSQLKVQFFWPFRADYWVLYVDSGYKTAIVSTRNRKYLWFISREKTISATKYQQLYRLAQKQGFDMSRLKETNQSC